MKKICTSNAPAPAGHYEQGLICNGFLFVSGQLPIDPTTKEILHGPVKDQAKLALENMKAVVEAGGSSLDKIAKVTVFISNVALWDEVNAVYSEFFGSHKPCRSIVPTRDLHHGVKIEIEAIALA